MTTFSLNIFDDKVDISNRDGLSRRFLSALISIGLTLTVVFVYALLTLTSINEAWFIIILFLNIFIINRFTRHIQKDWLTLKKCIGKVDFTDQSIVVSTLSNNIQLDNISQIKLLGDYYQGCTLGSRDIIHNGLYDISITNKSGEENHFKFVAFNKQEFQALTDFFELLYSKFNISINEKIGSERQTGFLLRHDRSYKDIQDLKSRLFLNRQ